MKYSSLVIATVTIFLSTAQAANPPFQNPVEYKSKHGILEITPSQNDAPKFDFQINANVDMYVCEAEGTAYITERDLSSNTWSATALVSTDSDYGDQYCKMEFSMDKAGKIAIKTSFGCSAQCGMGAVGAMNNIYKK
ncbi:MULTISPECIES: hypothetical protein [Providencia]|nr:MULTISPECIES: hypothetical protein [Providencia]MBJ9972862.1 hypothetical protein [Providencia rettgeri]MCB6146429.1 hypothetical protein [Providencia rettgeri]MCF8964638.1 hypothetical protein [Providencia rettgeri]TNV03999.1 hypothetical protein FH869_03620 [Providencia rettgeri]UDQ68594.1 hypothetical protein LHK11_06765 [Providencia rettgeri]